MYQPTNRIFFFRDFRLQSLNPKTIIFEISEFIKSGSIIIEKEIVKFFTI